MNIKSDGHVRYADTNDPVTTDGRDIDTGIATLDGEAAQQEVQRARRASDRFCAAGMGAGPSGNWRHDLLRAADAQAVRVEH